MVWNQLDFFLMVVEHFLVIYDGMIDNHCLMEMQDDEYWRVMMDFAINCLKKELIRKF
jgi:hypothetical protein